MLSRKASKLSFMSLQYYILNYTENNNEYNKTAYILILHLNASLIPLQLYVIIVRSEAINVYYITL